MKKILISFLMILSGAVCAQSSPEVTERKSGSVIVHNDNLEEVARYNFFEAWPCTVVGDGSRQRQEQSEAERVATVEMLHSVSELFSGIGQETGNETFRAVAASLAKLTLQPEKGDKIQVMFNPKEYTITKATPWKHHNIQGLDAPTLEFTSGKQHPVQFELFFDRYEEGKSVRELTDKIEKLALVHQELHRPPTRLLTWGTGLALKCVLESFSLRFTLFLDDGTPVRAVMNTVWKKSSPAEEPLKGNPRR